jgi:hypothetical protein
MAIEKGTYAAPKGIEEDIEEGMEGELVEQALEIDIVNPDMVTLDDGSVEITIIPDGSDIDMADFDVNLLEILDEGLVNELASELLEMVDSDVDSRKEWADTYVKGLAAFTLLF